MIGRIMWFAAIAAIALVTSALQLDKQAEANPALAPLVPPPLRNFAQTRIAVQAAVGDDPALALAEARTLVTRRPIPAEYLTLLAIAQAKAGQVEASGLTIQIAGQRGWRDPIAQEAVLRLALAAGDKPEAARRYAALFLRRATPDELLVELAAQVFASGEEGHQTFAAIVTGGDRWHEMFLQRGAQVLPPTDFAIITAMSIFDGAQFDCAALGQTIESLGGRDAMAADQVAMAAAGRCPQLAPEGMTRL